MPAVRRGALILGLLVAAFVAFSVAVASGALAGADRETAALFKPSWRPGLGPLFDGIALLGGVEATTLFAIAAAAYLARRGLRRAAWGMAAFPVAVALETLYKRAIHHPGPGVALTHPDAPSLTSLFAHTALLRNSFPSGHVTRAVVLYGLVAFAVWLISPSRRVRRLAVAGAVVMAVAISFDRLYLEVHWESDVIGGLLLGCICLVGAIIWIELPRLAGRR